MRGYMKRTILVVDDEIDILELMEYHLEKEGFSVVTAKSGGEALDVALSQELDLIVLDLMLPGINGLEVCKILKREAKTKNIPIIMVSAKGEEQDIITGLELGADDYIVKHFSPKVFIARVNTVLRRSESKKTNDENIIKIDGLQINLPNFSVTLNDEPIKLTLTEFNILALFARNPGRVFTRDQILDKVWPDETYVVDRTVDVHIRSLRKKLDSASKHIESIRGIGYRFKELEEK